MQVTLKWSMRLACFFILIHLVAMLSLLASLTPFWLKASGIVLCLYSFLSIWRYYVALNSGKAVRHLSLDEYQNWSLVQKNGEVLKARLQGDTVVFPFIVILNFKATKRHFSVIICKDSVLGETFRRLCVKLRTGRGLFF